MLVRCLMVLLVPYRLRTDTVESFDHMPSPSSWPPFGFTFHRSKNGERPTNRSSAFCLWMSSTKLPFEILQLRVEANEMGFS
uniref:Putative secreted protein n=1 Tax=Anopheles darlingi TaxID=43151 RepID=A0A2M4D4Y9_ANODA